MECCRRDRNIGLLAGEDEAGLGAVGFLNLDRCYDSIGGDGEGEALHAFLLSVRNTGEDEAGVYGGCHGQVIDFFFELGVAE